MWGAEQCHPYHSVLSSILDKHALVSTKTTTPWMISEQKIQSFRKMKALFIGHKIDY